MNPMKDEVGHRYGKLTVIEFVGVDNGGNAMWKCLCDCGKSTIVRGKALRSGDTKSCGCMYGNPKMHHSDIYGKDQFLRDWADCIGLAKNTMSSYIYSYKMGLDEVIEHRLHKDERSSTAAIHMCDDIGQTAPEWAECAGISKKSLRRRMYRGQTIKEIIQDRQKERIVLTLEEEE